ncbi:MAG: hypothetical protein EOP92_30005, partial [Lysobacteraceae bacterium]
MGHTGRSCNALFAQRRHHGFQLFQGGVEFEIADRALDLGDARRNRMAGQRSCQPGHPVAPRVAQIQGAIGDFEFDSALEQLEAVM